MVKLNSAESIRGLACLAVVFSHLSLTFFPYLHHFDVQAKAGSSLEYFIHHSPFAFWYSGTAAVFVFFVLSGFVLSYAILRKPELATTKIQHMLIKRYPRLAIPAVVSCLICWAILQATNIPSHAVNGWFQQYVTQNFSLSFAIYEGLIGSFFFAESSSNWVLWTLHIELIGSLVLFLLLFLYQKHRVLFHVGAVVLPLLAWYLKGEGFFLGIASFVVGIYYYLYGKSLKLWSATLLFIFGLYLAGAHNTSTSYQWIFALLGERTYDYCNVFAGFMIVYSVLMSRELSAKFDQKVLIWLGKLSFSVYLLHLIVLYVVGLPIFNSLLNFGVSYAWSAIFASVVFIVLTLFFAEFYSRWIDQFAINSSQQFSKYVLGFGANRQNSVEKIQKKI